MGECQELADRWRAEVDRARTAPLTLAEQRRIMEGFEPLLRVALVANPVLHPRIQRRLAGRWLHAAALMANPCATAEAQARVACNWGVDGSRAVLRRSVVHPDAQRGILARGPSYAVAGLASHPSLAPDVAAQLGEDAREPVLARLASNPVIARNALQLYAAWPRRSVRAGAAANPDLDGTAMKAMATDRSVLVRRSLARNPSLTPDARRVLLADRDVEVLTGLAGNPGIGSELMADFAGHAEPEVRLALAGNPRIPLALQRRLAASPGSLPALLAANPGLDPNLQAVLAGHPRAEVRITVAQRTDLRPEVQQSLAEDPEARTVLAANRALNTSARRTLLAQRDEDVNWVILSRQDANRDDLLAVLLSIVPSDRRDTLLLGALAFSGRPLDWDRRFLDHRMTGPGAAARTGRPWVVRAALEHPDPLVRIGGLLNPLASVDQVGELLYDSVPEVAQAARLAVLGRM